MQLGMQEPTEDEQKALRCLPLPSVMASSSYAFDVVLYKRASFNFLSVNGVDLHLKYMTN
jgi:hypothetical protein